MTTNLLRIDAQIELGCLFATVHASASGGWVGAHVDLDGTVLSDTGLVPLLGDETDEELVWAVRRVALTAIFDAHREIGIEADRTETSRIFRTVALALPLPVSF